jgi:hypothetical protein
MYVYIGTYYHEEHSGHLCVVNDDGEYVELEKKIGKTSDLTSRENALNRTKSPIGYVMLRAWKTGDKTDIVEQQLHAILAHNRVHGEWFSDNDEDNTLEDRVSRYMTLSNFNEVPLGQEDSEVVERITKNKPSKWDTDKMENLIGIEFSSRGITIRYDGKEQGWLSVNTGEYHTSANGAFSKTAESLNVQSAMNVWTLKDVVSKKTLREIHDGI